MKFYSQIIWSEDVVFLIWKNEFSWISSFCISRMFLYQWKSSIVLRWTFFFSFWWGMLFETVSYSPSWSWIQDPSAFTSQVLQVWGCRHVPPPLINSKQCTWHYSLLWTVHKLYSWAAISPVWVLRSSYVKWIYYSLLQCDVMNINTHESSGIWA